MVFILSTLVSHQFPYLSIVPTNSSGGVVPASGDGGSNAMPVVCTDRYVAHWHIMYFKPFTVICSNIPCIV